MIEEFNLSSLGIRGKNFPRTSNKHNKIYYEEDIKEFIKREDKLLELYQTKQISFEELLDKRMKIIGDKLL